MMIDEIINKNYIKNKKRILSIIKDNNFNSLINKIDKNKMINVPYESVFNSNQISLLELFIFNLDNYITFLKNYLNISSNELTYIVSLTINCDNNKILYDESYYYDNIGKYEREFINLFMFNYNKNIDFLSHYMYINKRDFKSLIDNMNKKKKRVYIYFENITPENTNFFIPIICFLEDINY